jgi:hypothetical protein
MAGALLASGVLLTACSSSGSGTTAQETDGAATVEDLAGQPDFKLVTLTDEAAKRIGIETSVVRDEPAAGGGAAQKVVPFDALIYDPEGATFVYTSPEPGTFVRAAVTVIRINGDDVLISDGPATGATVVTVGAAELLGTEYGVGED